MSGAPQLQLGDQMSRQLHKKQANQSGVIPPQVNKRSTSGASNKTQFNLNAIKGHSSTPKNQNLTSGIGSFRPSGGGLHLERARGKVVTDGGTRLFAQLAHTTPRVVLFNNNGT